MQKFVSTRKVSFKYAFSGWGYVIRTQPNTWIYAIVTFLVVIAGLISQISFHDWAILGLTFGLVWSAEFFNTAIETIFNLVHPEEHPLVKIGKDVGAGAVLVTAIFSVLVGLLILGPPLYSRFIAIAAR